MKCPCEAYVGTRVTSIGREVCTLYKSSAVGKGKKGPSTAASAGAGTRVKGSHSPTVSHHGTCKHARVDSGVS